MLRRLTQWISTRLNPKPQFEYKTIQVSIKSYAENLPELSQLASNDWKFDSLLSLEDMNAQVVFKRVMK